MDDLNFSEMQNIRRLKYAQVHSLDTALYTEPSEYYTA